MVSKLPIVEATAVEAEINIERPAPSAPLAPMEAGIVCASSATIIDGGSDGIIVVIPPGISDQDIVFSGTPNPKIEFVDPKVSSILGSNKILTGCYCSKLKLRSNGDDDITVSNIDNSDQLKSIFGININLHRELWLSYNAPKKEKLNGDGLVYRMKIPDGKALGVTFHGFPPVIQSVEELSSLYNKIHVGQIVIETEIPGFPVMNLSAGGFTADNLTKKLKEHGNISNRFITVQDCRVIKPSEKGSDDAFDFGGLTFWTPARLFSKAFTWSKPGKK